MSVTTYGGQVDSYISELITLLNHQHHGLTFTAETTHIRYDEMINSADKDHDYLNDFFIIKTGCSTDGVYIDAVCLYISSLRVFLHGVSVSDPVINRVENDIKIFLYSTVVKKQSSLFQRISENTWHLASGLSHELIIHNVVEGALKTIPFSDAVIFRIYDEASGLLRPLAVSGFHEDYYNYAVSLKESVSGRVFNSRQSVVLKSQREILASFNDASSVREETMKNNPIAESLICVPVHDKNYCYGTLTILSLRRHSVFNSLSVSLLEMFASQVALAWSNARLYDEKVSSFNELSILREKLEKQNRILKLNVDFYNDMIKMSIKNKEMSGFLNDISETIGVKVSYADISGIHYKNHDGNTDVAEFISGLWLSQPENDITFQQYYFYPMLQNRKLIGVIYIHSSELTDYIKMTLSRLSDFMVMDIMRKMSAVLLENKKKILLVNDAVRHGLTENVISVFSGYDFYFREYTACLLLESDTQTGDTSDVILYDLYKKITALLFGKNAFICPDGNLFTLFISEKTAAKVEKTVTVLSDYLKRSGNSRLGVSNISREEGINRLNQQAKTALDILIKKKASGVMMFSKAGLERLFVRHDKQELREFARDVLSELLDNDPRHQVLLETLKTYIHNACSVNNTAKEMGIHTNTLYQRLRKIESMTAMNLSDPDDFLIISLVCHLLPL